MIPQRPLIDGGASSSAALVYTPDKILTETTDTLGGGATTSSASSTESPRATPSTNTPLVNDVQSGGGTSDGSGIPQLQTVTVTGTAAKKPLWILIVVGALLAFALYVHFRK